MSRKGLLALWIPVVVLVTGVLIFAQEKKVPAEQERAVKEAEVPPAALAALKKLAAGAAITEFAEEIEHGSKFYEGSWKGPGGNVDGLVTEAGDLVEIEEVVSVDKVPAKARAEVEKEAGKEAKAKWEKKTIVMYEAHFTKDGKAREMILTPDGRRFPEEQDEHDKDEEDEE